MDKDILLKILDTGSMPLTLDEIEMIMDEEMAKDPSEMDGDLVDACIEILSKAHSKNEETAEIAEPVITENVKSRKRIKLVRIIAIAAIVAILLGVAITVGAKYINSDVSEEIVKFVADHFEIDLSGENNEAINYSDESIDIIKTLKDKGIENVILPAELLKEEYVKSISYFDEDNNFITIEIDFENKSKDFAGKMEITKHKTDGYGFVLGQSNASGNFDSVKKLLINGMDTLVFSNNERSYITFIDDTYEYNIGFNNCDFEHAIEIAKTLE